MLQFRSGTVKPLLVLVEMFYLDAPTMHIVSFRATARVRTTDGVKEHRNTYNELSSGLAES